MPKSYRLAPLALAFMGVLFILVGIFILAVPGIFGIGSTGLRVGIGVWSIFLGVLVGVFPFRAKLVVSDESIWDTNFKGKVQTCLKWSEIVDFQFEKTVTLKGSQYNVYRLVTVDGRKLEIPDNFGGWDEVRQIILTHLPNASAASMFADATSPSKTSSAKTDRKSTIFVGIFVSFWVILFCLFTYASKTAYRTTVVLRQSADGWHVHYTYYNDSRFNSLTFDIERTYLNGVEETKYPETGPNVKPGESCEIDLWFPSDVAKQGQAAHLRSWWQFSTGGNRHRTRTIDHYLRVDEPVTDVVDTADSS